MRIDSASYRGSRLASVDRCEASRLNATCGRILTRLQLPTRHRLVPKPEVRVECQLRISVPSSRESCQGGLHVLFDQLQVIGERMGAT
ncbi:hypothetical protein DPMN_069870 [Dreissena polymorpha]|uniref:Uncharacterized protein n=1 Tax=Dreissena polymorpha TaxID=45954 RepID=A0A9D3Z1Z7_DREPO|nr:hypothetical protein DPMN_069870 [Dreissena polymorpha]